MALVRVYCGLASAYPPRQLAVGSSSLSATIVDDAGRVLDTCEIGDDPYGYAYLSMLLAERATTGPYSVAIAADSNARLVPQLLITAGWALAFVPPERTDEFIGRFVDRLTEDLGNESEVAPNQRRALGLARALQAGAVSAAMLPPPAELVEWRPALTAHSALATGRHAAAVALREVLRELYPAALRAYSDPADPVALAVLAALPDPQLVAAPSGRRRGRDATADPAIEALVGQLTATGVADEATVAEAVTALRVAVAETGPASGGSRALAGTIATTVREVVASVRAYDAASTALVSVLAELTGGAGGAGGAGATDARGASNGAAVRRGMADPRAEDSGRSVQDPRLAATDGYADLPVSPPPPPPPGITPFEGPASPPIPDHGNDPAEEQRVRVPTPRPAPDRPPLGSRTDWPTSRAAAGRPTSAPAAHSAPVSSPTHRAPVSSPSTHAAPVSSPTHAAPVSSPTHGGAAGGPGAFSGAGDGPTGDYPRHQREQHHYHDLGPSHERSRSHGGVTPPWQTDDLQPPEPPALRLVEPTLPEELRGAPGYASPPHSEPSRSAPSRSEPPPLRLVEPTSGGHAPRSVPPVSADDDDNLLIFSQIRSAWFDQDDAASWNSEMDAGWQAAELAAKPQTGDRTQAGLPRRVPHANLVPGAPPRYGERPLRVVRDPERIAAHTSGYFSGWRRGQEVGGFPLGNRPARRSGGAWEFHRDGDRLSG